MFVELLILSIGMITQMLPSIAMMETYARLLLIAPHTLFRCHLTVRTLLHLTR